MLAGDSLDFSNATTIHPIGLAALIMCLVFLLFTSRYRAVLPILLLIAFIPAAQRIVIFGADFTFTRILLLVALARIFMKGEHRDFRLNNIDKTLIIWVFWSICAYGVLTASMSGIVTRTGYMVEAFGAYLVGRIFIRDVTELKKAVNFLGLISIPVAILFLVERSTGSNMFSVFGGVPFETGVRGGRLRCQGPFLHPIMAGIFWASILPWIGALWFSKEFGMARTATYATSALVIVVNTASSTPAMSVIFVIVGFAFFTIRSLMPLIRYTVLATAIFLQIVMEYGVFHLIARVDIAGGSTGYHRFQLIDEAIKNVGDWWLIGALSVEHWGEGLGDITNQYIFEGILGGMLAMILFILAIVLLYKNISRSMRRAETMNDIWVLWAIGTLMFMHVMNFTAASYFGSVVVGFYLFFGASVSLVDNDSRFAKPELTESRPVPLGAV